MKIGEKLHGVMDRKEAGVKIRRVHDENNKSEKAEVSVEEESLFPDFS